MEDAVKFEEGVNLWFRRNQTLNILAKWINWSPFVFRYSFCQWGKRHSDAVYQTIILWVLWIEVLLKKYGWKTCLIKEASDSKPSNKDFWRHFFDITASVHSDIVHFLKFQAESFFVSSCFSSFAFLRSSLLLSPAFTLQFRLSAVLVGNLFLNFERSLPSPGLQTKSSKTAKKAPL